MRNQFKIVFFKENENVWGWKWSLLNNEFKCDFTKLKKKKIEYLIQFFN